MLRTLLVLAVFFALLASPARSATVTATFKNLPGYRGSDQTEVAIAVTAAPGERNALRIVRTPTTPSTVIDDGAPLTAGTGCAATAAGVTCTPPPGMDPDVQPHVVVDAGDGDDTVTIDDESGGVMGAEVRGGPGADALTLLGHATGSLEGGPGDDVLRGAGALVDGGPGADVLDGGTVTYADRIAPVYAAVGQGDGGEAGEGDVLGPDVIAIRGGHGDDTLIGSDHKDTLIGGEGDDRLDGRGDDDRLYGDAEDGLPSHPTADVLSGGDGADLLATGPGGRADGGAGADRLVIAGDATAIGGPGADRVAISRAANGRTGARVDTRDGDRDLVHCGRRARLAAERLDARDVRFGCGRPPGRPAAGVVALTGFSVSGEVYLTLVCPDSARKGCPVAASARVDRVAVGRNRIRLDPGEEHELALPPGRRSAGRLLAEPGHTVRVTLTMRDQNRRQRTLTRSACLVQVSDLIGVSDRPGPC